MPELKTISISLLVYPDGQFQVSNGGTPVHWVNDVVVLGAEIQTLEADVVLPPEKPVVKARRIYEAAKRVITRPSEFR